MQISNLFFLSSCNSSHEFQLNIYKFFQCFVEEDYPSSCCNKTCGGWSPFNSLNWNKIKYQTRLIKLQFNEILHYGFGIECHFKMPFFYTTKVVILFSWKTARIAIFMFEFSCKSICYVLTSLERNKKFFNW